jgi:hypothetical protein
MQLANIETRIYEIRGQKVILHFDLAKLYETETKYLKRMARSNSKRFPADLMFELSKEEWKILRYNFTPQITKEVSDICPLPSQNKVPSPFKDGNLH